MRKNRSSALSLIPTAPGEPAATPAAAISSATPVPAPLAVQNVPEGFDDLLADDLVLPRLTIVQPTSQEGSPGTFRSSLTGEERRELQLVPLAIRRGRICWAETLGEDPVCKSNDGRLPASTVERPVSEECCVLAGGRLKPVCGAAVWRRVKTDDGLSRQEPPRCRETAIVVAVDLETQAPLMIAFHGTGIRSVRVLRTIALQKRLALFDAAATLRLRKVTNARGTYFVPEFHDVRPVEPAGKYRALYQQFATYNPEQTFEAEREAGGAVTEAAAEEPAF
ncbi:MAG: hypothetical protein HY907_06040 [Deltaproteobacteria bacterium]|nr:hypothetical protein [Deltaproteobacteria bacterium]